MEYPLCDSFDYFLYFIGKLPFFRGVQVGTKGGVVEEFLGMRKKSTGKEVLSTVVFGLILMALVVGFFIIMFKGSN